jgi:hypothetical protein
MCERAHRRDAHARSGPDESKRSPAAGRTDDWTYGCFYISPSASHRARRFAHSPFRLAPESFLHFGQLSLQLLDSLIEPGQSLEIHLLLQELSDW